MSDSLGAVSQLMSVLGFELRAWGGGLYALLATERLSIPPSVVLIIHFGLFFMKLGFVVLFVWFVF